jgi:hypothetical protein
LLGSYSIRGRLLFVLQALREDRIQEFDKELKARFTDRILRGDGYIRGGVLSDLVPFD